MGHRANYVIVEAGGYALYSSHWGALSVPGDVFWGPDHAERFIRRQERSEPPIWLDDIWAEGGALLDPGRRRLILFGGDELSCDVPLRRFYLELLAAVWHPWRVSWAYEGLADFADHLDLDRAAVLSGTAERFPAAGPPSLADEFPPLTICSLVQPGGPPALYPLATMIDQLLPRGPGLVEELGALPPAAELEVDLSTGDGPDGGLHLDPDTRALSAWLAAPAPDVVQRMAAWWPGWSFDWRRDDYQSHGALCGGRLSFSRPDRGALVERLAGILLGEAGRAPIAAMLGLIERLEEQGETVEVNPQVLAEAPQDLPDDERRRIFEAALAGLRRAS